MKVTVTQIAPHPQGLRLGLRIEHEKAAWIRFATTVLLVEELTTEERGTLYHAMNKAIDDFLDSEPTLPLF
jgi:hypothetical protein